MQVRKLGLPFLFVWIVLVEGIGQDPRYAQFYAVPLQSNPAMSGVFEGRARFSANYRSQFPGLLGDQPYTSFAVSGENRFRVINRDYFSLGLSARQDEAGVGQFTRSQAMLGASFLKQLSGGGSQKSVQYLVAGFQTAVEQYGIQTDALWFSSQYNNGTNAVDYGVPSGESTGLLRSSILGDINLGLLWYLVQDGKGSLYAGIAGQHILEPSIRFLNEAGTPFYRRITANLGGEWSYNKNSSLLPAIQVMVQGPHSSIMAGSHVRYANRFLGDIALRTGAWLHLAGQAGTAPIGIDALTISTNFELGRMNWGLSYDITLSPLRQSNYGKGGLELSFSYRQPAKERFKVKCPRF